MKTTITNTKKQNIFAYVLLIALTVLAVKNASAQSQAANWYFGNRTGFNIGTTPYMMEDGVLQSDGSCTSYSEPTGELAIYSDGQTVWNAKHVVVYNGDNLIGDRNSSQGVLMVKMPALPHFIFVFTVGEDSLRYTLVDIAAFSHLGQVDPMRKNIAFAGAVEHKLTAVNDGNGNTWLVAHGRNNNKYMAWKLSGIEYPETITPVISSVGNIDNFGDDGCMKLSPNGSTIARTLPGIDKFEWAKFDINTGVVSDVKTVMNMQGCFGVEFSSYSNRLYVTTTGSDRNFIHQFNLALPTYNDIVTSKQSLIPDAGVFPKGLQLGYDGILYVGNSQSSTVGVITNADTLGADLIYGAEAYDLGRTINNNLPAFNQSYFARTAAPVVTAVGEDAATMVSVFPNPSNGMFKLNIGENRGGDVKLNVFNMTGAKVYSADKFDEGQKIVSVDLTKQPAGVYFFEVTTPGSKTIKRLVIN